MRVSHQLNCSTVSNTHALREAVEPGQKKQHSEEETHLSTTRNACGADYDAMLLLLLSFRPVVLVVLLLVASRAASASDCVRWTHNSRL